MATTDHRREHHWDAIRAFLMILGIPYHVALAYRPGKPWIVNSASDGAPLFVWIAETIHLFRMPAFFVVAGYFAAMLLRRRAPGAWLLGRLRRLGIPFVVSILTLVPIMNMAAELSNFPLPAAIRSWLHESRTSGGYWVRHLWFIITLLQLSAAAALLFRWHPALRTAKVPRALDASLGGRPLVTVGAACILVGLWSAFAVEGFYAAGLATNVPQQILRIDDFIASAPYFAIGVLLQRAPILLSRLSMPSTPLLVVAAFAIVTDIALADMLHPMVVRFIGTIAAITLTQSIVALAFRFFSGGGYPLVERIVPASFTVYLFHLPIVVILVVAAQSVPAPAYVRAPLVMLLTFALSWGAWAVVARVPLLRLLFDGAWPTHKTPTPGALVQAA